MNNCKNCQFEKGHSQSCPEYKEHFCEADEVDQMRVIALKKRNEKTN